MKKRMVPALALAVSMLVMAALFLSRDPLANQVQAQTGETGNEEEQAARTINVSGQGSVQVRPDTAVVRLGVETQAETAAEALQENSTRMSELIAALEEAEVAGEDIQTQTLQLQPVYEGSGEGESPAQLTGYRAINVVQIRTTDLDNIGALLDTAVDVGGNRIEAINFEVSDREVFLAAAREAAMNDARQKAGQLASLADAELGEVVMISETGATSPAPVAIEASFAADRVPIAAGAQTVEVFVQVTWRLQ